MALGADDWLELIGREYLDRFVPQGGAAVKFVAGDEATLAHVRDGLRALAAESRMDRFEIDAAVSRVHMIQDVFFAMAREIDWEALAQRWIEEAFCEHYHDWPRPGEAMQMRELADANEIAEPLLARDVRRWLTAGIMADRELAQDFRAAMVALCMSRMEPGDARAATPVVDWLRGELKALGAVRPAQINARITRHNARAMLKSLCRWLRHSGSHGVVVTLDLRQISWTGPVFGEARRYTPAAVLDAFEVLRQIIDDAESFEGLLLVGLVDPAFGGDDPRRSVSAYPALKERIWPDVHPRGHENPLAPLLLLSPDRTGLAAQPVAMDFSPERQAIESLRAGVPNRAAVRLLGAGEAAPAKRLSEKLDLARRDGARAQRGEIVAGGFGAGKSHLMSFLADAALREDFVVSQVAISKETPLFDPERLFAAAMRNAVAPGMNDDAMTAALSRLDPQSPGYEALAAWAASPGAGLSPLFAALLHAIPRGAGAPEDRAAIARFLGGARLGLSRVRQWLKASGAARLYDLKPVRAPELALQRLRFAPRLFRAAGFSGWCVLIDEVELVGRYSLLQRAKSYAELARWLGLDPGEAMPGVISVAALTDDFRAAILDGKADRDKAPRMLEGRGLMRQAELATLGIEAIDRRQHHLARPDAARLAEVMERVAELYRQAYGWQPLMQGAGERRAGATMRQYVKGWITEWDMLRLGGGAVDIATEASATDYSENPDLEAPAAEAERPD